MRILIKDTIILHPDAEPSQGRQSILIEDGVITEIKSKISAKVDNIIESGNSFTSSGWVDVGTNIGEPGYEHREDIESVTKAAAAGGYTMLLSSPNTLPVTQSKSDVLFIKQKSEDKITNIRPMGALSIDCLGKDMTEMFDLHDGGAVAFTDGAKSIQDSGFLKRALEYVQAFDGLVLHSPINGTFQTGWQMHEGLVSTSMGMKGIPPVAEEMMVGRDIKLLQYTGGKLHLYNISTLQSVDLIRKAKKQGLNISCSVPVMNLCFDDDALMGFDSNFKVTPPLRTSDHRLALLKGVQEGVIDFVTSNHTPIEHDLKELEFPYAKFGVIQLETAYSLLATLASKKITPQLVAGLFSHQPRKIFGLHQPEIKTGEMAELTVFDPDITWVYESGNILSKSKNNPMVGKKLSGKTIATIRGKRIFAQQ
jgi:dihydroorotase